MSEHFFSITISISDTVFEIETVNQKPTYNSPWNIFYSTSRESFKFDKFQPKLPSQAFSIRSICKWVNVSFRTCCHAPKARGEERWKGATSKWKKDYLLQNKVNSLGTTLCALFICGRNIHIDLDDSQVVSARVWNLVENHMVTGFYQIWISCSES